MTLSYFTGAITVKVPAQRVHLNISPLLVDDAKQGQITPTQRMGKKSRKMINHVQSDLFSLMD